MRKIIYFFALIIISATSCTKRIDCSSDSKMELSISNIKNSLEKEKKEKFEKALLYIMFKNIKFKEMITDNAGRGQDNFKLIIKGKSADEIIQISEELKKTEAKKEIDELYLKKNKSILNKNELAKFKINKSKLYRIKTDSFLEDEKTIIEITVKNETNKAISKVYFTGILSSPNRSVPWLKDEFNYSVSGGIEPNENVTWYLSPNMFSEWCDIKIPNDAIFNVLVDRIDDANGNELYSITGYDEDDEKRLNELLSSYPEFIIN